MTKAKHPTKTPLGKTSRLLTTSERRDFFWQSLRMWQQHGGLYWIFVNVPREDAMEDKVPPTLERHGVKAAFEWDIALRRLRTPQSRACKGRRAWRDLRSRSAAAPS
jgi:hypothetical protein